MITRARSQSLTGLPRMPSHSAPSPSENRAKTGYDEDILPPAYEEDAQQGVQEGLYVIKNRRSRSVLDLREGAPISHISDTHR